MSAINLVGACRSEGYGLSVGKVLKAPVLRDMAAYLKHVDSAASGKKKAFETPEWLEAELKSHDLRLSDQIDYTYPCPPGQVEFLNQGQRDDQFWVLMNIRPLAPSIEVDKWIDAVTELTRVNDILRTCYVKNKGQTEWIGVVLKEPVVDMVQHDCKGDEDRSSVIEEIWNDRFSLGKPWIRYAILNLAEGKRDILIKLDHATYDGTLLRIFDEHFAAIQRSQQLPAYELFRTSGRE